MDYKSLYEQQLKENAKLKEANDTFTLGARRTIESNCKLYKENQELKEEIDGSKVPQLKEQIVSLLEFVQQIDTNVEKLIEDKDQLKKISNVKTDLINNLFSKIVQNADIDDGISISKDYGHKYIDEWNKMYEDVIKDTIEVMNEHELDCVLKFHDCGNIEFCMEDSDDDSDEEDE
tara:strand:+ start:167 stop:694 length:528 start_codon:yes stop_codon:yes gene_type:complete